jgi:hypothetical protein
VTRHSQGIDGPFVPDDVVGRPSFSCADFNLVRKLAYASTRAAVQHWDQRGQRDALGSNWQQTWWSEEAER